MRSEDIDISETSNSAYLSWRQKISDGCIGVAWNAMPAGAMRPSRTARERAFGAMAMDSGRSAMGPLFRDGARIGETEGGAAMETSRREMMLGLGAGAAVLAMAARNGSALAQQPVSPGYGEASAAEAEL